MFGFKRAEPKRDRLGDFLYQIFGPANVQGAMQGWSPEAREQYKRMRQNYRRSVQEPRDS